MIHITDLYTFMEKLYAQGAEYVSMAEILQLFREEGA